MSLAHSKRRNAKLIHMLSGHLSWEDMCAQLLRAAIVLVLELQLTALLGREIAIIDQDTQTRI